MPKLTYTRKIGESITIAGAEVTFLEVRGNRISFTIEADENMVMPTRRESQRDLGREWPPPVTGE